MKAKWTEEAWAEASGIYADIIGHPFIKELADGSLSSRKFDRYIAQDELYLGNYGRQMFEFAQMIPDPQQREMFTEFAKAGMEGEKAMHELLISRFGINTKVCSSGVTAAYNAHTERAIRSGRKEIAFAALLPCIWIYNEVGLHILSIAKMEGNPYREWIEEYGNEEFTQAVSEVLDLIDEYASQADEATRSEMTREFREGARFEYLFWDYGYYGSPLVLNVTNYVAMNFSANVLLAAGASPIMSFFPDEMEDLMQKCDGLVINIGCLDRQLMEASVRAAEVARSRGITWVLDPAGVGASEARKAFCRELAGNCHPAIIRANASEVLCLEAIMRDGQVEGGRGVDATVGSEDAVEAAKALALRCGCVVSMSGESDFVTDGERVRRIDGGSPLMPMVTAMGCSASALTAAFAAEEDSAFEAAIHAMELMAHAGEAASCTVCNNPGTFQMAFIDAIAQLRHHRRRFSKEMLKLYLVTDRGLAGERSIEEIAVEAAKGGATMVQLREKNIDTEEFIRRAIQLKKALQPLGVPLIINDRVDVALAADADGVHIGQSDMPYEMARKLLGRDKIIGLSVENLEQVAQANTIDVDYVGISPVFATPTKTDTAAPFGLDGLREAVALSKHPTVAIGGMNAKTAADVMKAGADGIAVVSAIVCAQDPRAAASELLSICNE